MIERDDISSTIDRMLEAMNDHHLGACVDCYSEDAELQDPRFPEPVRGAALIREGFQYWFDAFPDVHVVITKRIIDPPDVALEWTFEATHVGEYLGVPGSGQRFKVLTAAHFQVRDGKVTRDFSLFDATGLRTLEEHAAAHASSGSGSGGD